MQIHSLDDFDGEGEKSELLGFKLDVWRDLKQCIVKLAAQKSENKFVVRNDFECERLITRNS